MRTRLLLAGLAACIVLPGIFVNGAKADHKRHWFYDSYNQYEDDTFTYYVPERWQRRRPPGAASGNPDYDEEYLTERQYRRMLRAERRKARRLQAKRRKAERKKRWRKRQVRYDLAPKNSKLRKRRQLANVPLPRARPLTDPFVITGSTEKPADIKPVETATLGNSPLTIAPVEPAPAKIAAPQAVRNAALQPADEATPEPVTRKPIAPIAAKPAQDNKVQTAAISPAPAEPKAIKPKAIKSKAIKPKPASKVATKKVKAAKPAKKVKGRMSCQKAEKIVAGFGFTDIETKSCEGKSYDFAAQRDGKPFTITLSSKNGELTEVKRN